MKMRFMMLVKGSRDSEAGVMPDEKVIVEILRYNEELSKAGRLLAAEGLHASSEGTRVHYKNGKFTVIDGPFTESKELVAGYCLLQFASKTEGIEWTKRFLQVDAPGRHLGEAWSEIRPIIDDGSCQGLEPQSS